MPLGGRQFVPVRAEPMTEYEKEEAAVDSDGLTKLKFLPEGPNPRTDDDYRVIGTAKHAARMAARATEYIGDMTDRLLKATQDYSAALTAGLTSTF